MKTLVEAVIELQVRNERLEKAIRDVIETDQHRQLGVIYRRDGVPSKHDTCIHGARMYESCDNCTAEHLTVALST